MELGLAGRVAVVTGASRGIGLAIVQGLAAEGAEVVAGARGSSPELDELARSGGVRVLPVDLTEEDGPARLVDFAGERIDVLVNNVGKAPVRTAGFLDVTDTQWMESLQLNLLPAVRITRQVLPVMLAAGKGAIVNISSVNWRLPDPRVIDYGAAKAALTNFSKALSKEVGGRGIRINTVSPGPVATALWLGTDGVAATVSQVTGLKPQDIVDQAAQQSVTGRFTQPEEVAELVLLLASDRTANVTGADFIIDGGLITTL